jgi:hypothetical protein
VVDGRNCLDPGLVKAAGLAYEGVGRVNGSAGNGVSSAP